MSLLRVTCADIAVCEHFRGESLASAIRACMSAVVQDSAERGFRAIDDKCTHEDESLSESCLWGEDVECPAHGSRFNLLSGEADGLPATKSTRVYNVIVKDETVYIDL
jgi:nitrite reductase/ring-hydroxylating ferredoxin subunit